MKHWLVFAVLGLAIAILALKPSAVDKLLHSRPRAAVPPGENIFAEVNPDLLPVTSSHFKMWKRPTVVVFHDKNCPATRQLDRELEEFSRVRPDVAIRKVRISPDTKGGKRMAYNQAIEDYRRNIWMTPTVVIYDENGKFVEGDDKLDTSGSDVLYKWMAREAQRAFDEAEGRG